MPILAVFFVLVLSGFLIGAGIEDIDKNIDANKSKLQKKNQEKAQISNILNTLGSTINQKHNQIKQLNMQIENIQKISTKTNLRVPPKKKPSVLTKNH